MNNRWTARSIGKVGSLVLLASLAAGMGSATAEEELIGSEEYRISCLSCHGVGGKGDGPMAQFLTVKPSDLTVLARNNGGQYPDIKAGKYPFQRVFQIIDGRTLVSGHGDRAMPVWGNRYQMDVGEKYGPMGGEKAVRGRILELVYYIQMIQTD
jgi:mono/diheme cytochrome c family protein